jgi:hypothetical protein
MIEIEKRVDYFCLSNLKMISHNPYIIKIILSNIQWFVIEV